MKKGIAVCLFFTLLLSLFTGASAAAEKDDYTVTVTKTAVKADSAVNTSGFASLQYLSDKAKEDLKKEMQGEIDYYGSFQALVEAWGFEDEEEFYREMLLPETALMNADGKLIKPFVQSANAYYVFDGVISKGNLFYSYNKMDEKTDGFFSLDGSKLISTPYRFARPFSDGIAFVRKVETVTETIIDFNYDDDGNYYEYEEEVEYEKYTALLIDKSGKTVLELPQAFSECDGMGDGPGGMLYTHTGMCGMYSEGMINFSVNRIFDKSVFEDTAKLPRQCDRAMWLSGFMDLKGNVVIKQQFAEANPFSEGLAAVQEAIIEDADEFEEGEDGTIYSYAHAEAGKWGFISRDGKLVIPFQYDAVSSFHDGYAVVQKNGKYGVIDKTGKTVVPTEYDMIYMGDDGVFVYQKDGKIELRTPDGSVLWDTTADKCDDFTEFYNGVLYYIQDHTVYTVKARHGDLPGDVDGSGDLSAADARLALRGAVGLESYAPGSPEFIAADADKNGKLEAADARLILRAAVGLDILS